MKFMILIYQNMGKYILKLIKQKKGKARMKQFGSVEIPQEAFIGVLKINKDS